MGHEREHRSRDGIARNVCADIDWELREDGPPTKGEVTAALTAHHGASKHDASVSLSTAVGEVINWARACRQPGAAVVLDTETTGLDGVVIEIAIVDACTGKTLLDTLVNPGDVKVSDGARAVHGITDRELAGAPSWAEILPAFLAAVRGRRILAYNAEFDSSAIAAGEQTTVSRAAARGRSIWPVWRRSYPERSGSFSIRSKMSASVSCCHCGKPSQPAT
jgi:hypothetical protein